MLLPMQVAPAAGEMDTVKEVVKKAMTAADGGCMSVPLVVNFAEGPSWGDMA